MNAFQLEYLTKIILVVACGCVLPSVIVWLQTRRKINESKDRTQIVLAALEKNPNLDVEELIKKMAPTQKKTLLKEKLLTKLLWGGIFALLGLGLLGFCAWWGFAGGMNSSDLLVFSLTGAVLLAIGGAFLVNYFIGKKMLAKEMEAEQQNLLEQA